TESALAANYAFAQFISTGFWRVRPDLSARECRNAAFDRWRCDHAIERLGNHTGRGVYRSATDRGCGVLAMGRAPGCALGPASSATDRIWGALDPWGIVRDHHQPVPDR